MKRLLVLLIVAACVASAAAMAQASPVPGAEVKVSQPPDWVSPWAVAVESQQVVAGEPLTTLDRMCADDWMCPDGRPITDIHWWGVYGGNAAIASFRISIFSDVPEGPTNGLPSHPGNLLYSEMFAFSNTHEEYTGSDVFQYYVYLPKPFLQTEGTIYWLSVEAIPVQPTNISFWFWNTAVLPDMQHNLDDAIFIADYDFETGLYDVANYPISWHDLTFTYGDQTYSLDMAFELTTVPEPTTIVMIGGALLGFAAMARRKFLNR
jgi:hypothetical protein